MGGYGYLIPSFKNKEEWYTCKGHKDGTNSTVFISKVLSDHKEAARYKNAVFVATVLERKLEC